MNNKYGLIYQITNKKNNKKYIGQTTTGLKARIAAYKHETHRKKYLLKSYIMNALRKDFDSFTWNILEYCETQTDLDLCEIKYIKKFNTTNRKFGYNLKSGGNGGGRHSEKTKIKLSEKSKKQTNRNVINMLKWQKINGPINKKHFTKNEIELIIDKRLSLQTTHNIALLFNCTKGIIGKIIKNIYINGVSLNDSNFIAYMNRLKIANIILPFIKDNNNEFLINNFNVTPKVLYKIKKEYNIWR